MVGTRAEALFTAEGDFFRVQQIAEEFPPRGGLVTVYAHGTGNPIQSLTGRHGARYPAQTILISGHQMGIGRQYGYAVARRDKKTRAHDHVAVAVAVGGGPQHGRSGRHHQFGQFMGINQIGVWVSAAKILQRNAIDDRTGSSPKLVFENPFGIRAGDGVHGIEANGNRTCF